MNNPSDLVRFNLRMPPERYLALHHLANMNEVSMNRQINVLIGKALSEACAEVREILSRQDDASFADDE